MTVYIGVDFHARQQTISYLTTEEGGYSAEVLRAVCRAKTGAMLKLVPGLRFCDSWF